MAAFDTPIQPAEAHIRSTLADERFLLLLDTLPYPAFVIAAGSQAIHYNSQFVAYVGFYPGPGRADRTALHHPDDQALLEAARNMGVASDTDYVVEARLRRHDGAFRWHRIHNKPLFRDGRRIAYLGTAVDVDDSRRLNDSLERRVRERTAELEAANVRLTAEEARYRDLYNHTPMALHSSDGNASLVDVNDTWLEMLGYAREAVIGRSPSTFMTAASAQVFRTRAWPEMLESGGAVQVVDCQLVTAAGRVIDGRLAARGVFDEAGRLIRTWSAIADITAEKQVEGALRQAQRLDAIGQLTAGIAHDFNNLLTAILGNLELAARPGPQNEERRLRLIAGARTAAERGAALTGQLLAFSRQQRIVAEPLDVNRVIEGMLPLLTSSVGFAFEVTLEIRHDMAPALADATQLELAVLNLVINARDAMGTGGRITIATALATAGVPGRAEEPDPGDYVTVAVRDDGPGIPDSVRDRMFEPFFTTKGVGRGSGLGLAQVLGIVKQLGGGIQVCLNPGKGTMVTLFLPRAGEAGKPGAVLVDSPVAAWTTGRCRILLVDDDPDVRTATGLMLREAGHTVTEVESGAAALVACARSDGRFDLLLADVAMPGMTGLELAAQVRKSWAGIPVLFMTGYSDERLFPSDTQEVVLPKPFRIQDLEAFVARATGSR
jgi:PAS domain S-box-containing protein